MRLVEKHVIKESKEVYKDLDRLCRLSKNLYNAGLYLVRQEYIKTSKYLSYYDLNKLLKDNSNYIDLGAMISQQTLRVLDQNFRSFFAANQDYKLNPSKYNGKPKIPRYLDKDGKFSVIFPNQRVSKPALREGIIILSGLKNYKIPTKIFRKKDSVLNQVRLIPSCGKIVIEVVYTIPDKDIKQDNGRYAAIDLGINNLATITSNIEGYKPIVIDGRRVKSFNQHYNKLKSKYQSLLGKTKSTKRLRSIESKRENKINDYFHKSTRYIVNHLVSMNINTLIIGRNKGWKQDTNLGKTGNQNFIQIPFYKFILMLQYKCRLEGISVELVTEEYTSKCSFLDREEIKKHDVYLGKRKHRGLFISSSGKSINADVNGSYNILRKCKPGAFNANGVQGVVVHPHILWF